MPFPPDDGVVARRLTQFIEVGSRVLVLGYQGSDALVHEIRARSCHVVLLASAGAAAHTGAPPASGEVVYGSLDDAAARALLPQGAFDTVVVSDALALAPDPGEPLKAAAGVLKPEGFILGAVPNARHGTRRLAMLARRGPAAPVATDIRRGYELETLSGALTAAGFVLAHIERVEAPIDTSAFANGGPMPVADLLASLYSDPEAVISDYVAVAFPSPNLRAAALNRAIDALRRRCDAAELQARELSTGTAHLEAELAAERRMIAEQQRELTGLRSELDLLRSERARLSADLRIAHDTSVAREQQIATLRAERDRLIDVSLRHAEAELAAARNELAGVYGSRTWRWGEPIGRFIQSLGLVKRR